MRRLGRAACCAVRGGRPRRSHAMAKSRVASLSVLGAGGPCSKGPPAPVSYTHLRAHETSAHL
eukprot:9123354-Alexandrium_andersonii.AAC.1